MKTAKLELNAGELNVVAESMYVSLECDTPVVLKKPGAKAMVSKWRAHRKNYVRNALRQNPKEDPANVTKYAQWNRAIHDHEANILERLIPYLPGRTKFRP